MKSILYISGSQLPSKYANSVHVMKMCQALAENNIHTTLVGIGTDNNSNLYKYYNVKETFKIARSKFISNNLIRFINYNWFCFNQIRANHNSTIYLRYFYPIIWCIIFNRPIILEFHGVSKSKIINYLIKSTFNSKHLISAVFITDKLLDIYKSKFKKLPLDKCIVLADCADEPNELIKNKDTKSIGYVGHLYKGRGVELMIKIAETLPDTKFHIVGGHEKDVEIYKRISPINMHYYGFVTQSELSNIYGKFSIALAPYQNVVNIGKAGVNTAVWMSPMKVFEYMSYKKAIILSDLPALHEIGEDNVHFLYVAPNNYKEWVNAILELQNNSCLFEKLINNSNQKFKRQYTWNNRAASIFKLL